MARALELAALGEGQVEPNPMVGCVLVRDGRIIAEGHHEKFGGPHAEAAALTNCENPREATAYVTLEPCAHHGKTPPCAEALVAAGIHHAVVAMIDPDPRVAGRGIARLQAAGIDVTIGSGEAAASRLVEPFVKRVTTGLPWVIAKWAQTLDGKTATASGDSKWISNAESRRVVHELRGRVDAIVVGIGTALADDPSLTAREVQVRRVARRVVVDRAGKLPAGARLLTDQGPPVLIATSESVAADHPWPKHAEVIGLPLLASGRLDLSALMRYLAEHHDVTNVLAEGGAGLTAGLVEQGLADRLLTFIAPKLLGDPAAMPSLRGIAGEPCEAMDRARPLRLVDVQRLGDDVMLDYRLG